MHQTAMESKNDALNLPALPKKAAQILDAAVQEFLDNGYAGTTMDRIAATAGVSKPTVYSHFHSKEDLFAVLIERLAKEKFRMVFDLDDPQSLRAEPRILLRRIISNILDIAGTEPDFVAFIRLIIGESGRFPELAKPYLHNIAKPALETLSHYLALHPDLKLADPEAIARIILGSTIYYIILQDVLHAKDVLPMERDRLINSLLDLIVGAQ